MITDDLLTAAVADLVAGKLSATAQSQLLTYIRELAVYHSTPGLFPGLTAKLAAADGDTAQYLQAALNGAKAIGAGEENLGAGKASGVNWDRKANRDEFFTDALNYLYDVPVQRPTSAVVQMHGQPSTVRGQSCDFGNKAVLVF